jgi:hypothetical protein
MYLHAIWFINVGALMAPKLLNVVMVGWGKENNFYTPALDMKRPILEPKSQGGGWILQMFRPNA